MVCDCEEITVILGNFAGRGIKFIKIIKVIINDNGTKIEELFVALAEGSGVFSFIRISGEKVDNYWGDRDEGKDDYGPHDLPLT